MAAWLLAVAAPAGTVRAMHPTPGPPRQRAAPEQLPDHPEPIDGYWTARRAQQRRRRRRLSLGSWLQRLGALALVGSVLWFTLGDDVVGRWRQYDQRADLAAGTTSDTSWDPTLYAAPGDPVFGLGAAADPAQVSLVALPGEELDAPAAAATDAPAPAPDPDQPAAGPAELSFRMRADDIDLDWVVGDGVSKQDLTAGPGWMRGTAVPGAGGNTVISGHRTTYGAPFNRLDELEPGDRITLDMPGGARLVYRVADVYVVDPATIEVAYPTDASQLTLTTCTPTGTARYRLVVQAEQVSGPGTRPAVAFTPFAGDRIDDPSLRD